MKACKGESYNAELDYFCAFYKEDLSRTQLEAQLPPLKALCDTEGISCSITIHDVVRILGGLSSAERVAFSSVWTIMKLLLVMPASSERSFSALRRIKTYLHTTTTQQCLNNLMLLHVHKEKTVTLDLLKTGREFVTGREDRLRTFGDFK